MTTNEICQIKWSRVFRGWSSNNSSSVKGIKFASIEMKELRDRIL